MFLNSKLLFIFTETPLHAGAGAGLGVVDLPIQRERATSYPLIQASGLKGALRSAVPTAVGADVVAAVFGPELATATEADASQSIALYAGALSPGDARVLLFPVRALTGVFAWITSLDALQHFRRAALQMGLQPPALPTPPPAANRAYAAGTGVSANGVAVLEEFAFNVQVDATTQALAGWLARNALPTGAAYDYWRVKLPESLLILPQDAFRDFVLHATEVLTRVRLDPETKTVVRGALWTEEHLPSDTLLYAPMHATRLRTGADARPAALQADDPTQEATNVLTWAADATHIPHWLQIGGDETVGRGIVHLRWLDPATEVQA